MRNSATKAAVPTARKHPRIDDLKNTFAGVAPVYGPGIIAQVNAGVAVTRPKGMEKIEDVKQSIDLLVRHQNTLINRLLDVTELPPDFSLIERIAELDNAFRTRALLNKARKFKWNQIIQDEASKPSYVAGLRNKVRALTKGSPTPRSTNFKKEKLAATQKAALSSKLVDTPLTPVMQTTTPTVLSDTEVHTPFVPVSRLVTAPKPVVAQQELLVVKKPPVLQQAKLVNPLLRARKTKIYTPLPQRATITMPCSPKMAVVCISPLVNIKPPNRPYNTKECKDMWIHEYALRNPRHFRFLPEHATQVRHANKPIELDYVLNWLVKNLHQPKTTNSSRPYGV